MLAELVSRLISNLTLLILSLSDCNIGCYYFVFNKAGTSTSEIMTKLSLSSLHWSVLQAVAIVLCYRRKALSGE